MVKSLTFEVKATLDVGFVDFYSVLQWHKVDKSGLLVFECG